MWNKGSSETNPRVRKQRDQWRVRLKKEVPGHFCSSCLSLCFIDDPFCVHCQESEPDEGWPPVDTSNDPWLGEAINDRYLIASALGRGSSGDVYRGESLSISREFAIKIIATDRQHGEAERVIERLNREIEALSRLRNPHIVSIYEILDLRGRYVAAVMDLIEGQTLESAVEDHGPMSVSRALPLLRQISNGIYGAHQAGIIHRDLKPENLMVERLPAGDDFIHILDFGIVRLTDDTSTSLTHGFIGTPLYASPEQATAKPLDHRSDIYSLGAILFFLLTGRPPFPSENVYDVLRMHVRKPAPTLSETVQGHDFPVALEELVARMLSKSPDDRPDDLTKVIHQIDRIAHQYLSENSREPEPRHTTQASPPSVDEDRPDQSESRAPSSGVLTVPENFQAGKGKKRKRRQTPPSGKFRAPRLGGVSSSQDAAESNDEPTESAHDPADSSPSRPTAHTPIFQRQATPRDGSPSVNAVSGQITFHGTGSEDSAATALPSANYTLKSTISQIVADYGSSGQFALLERDINQLRLFQSNATPPRQLHPSHSSPLEALALANKRLIVGHGDGTIAQIDLDNGGDRKLYQDIRRVPITALAIAEDPGAILAGSHSGRLYYHHPHRSGSSSWKRIGPSGAPVQDVALSEDGDTLAVGRSNNTVEIINSSSPRSPMSSFSVDAPIRSMAISPDQYLLAAALVDRSVVLLQLPTGRKMLSLETEEVEVLAINFSPTGNPIAVCSIDRQIRLLEFEQIGSMASRRNS